jgi:hypothetical protein
MNVLLDIINVRWEETLRGHHRRNVGGSPIIEAWREGGLVAAAFPPTPELFAQALGLVPGFGAEIVIVMFESTLQEFHAHAPDCSCEPSMGEPLDAVALVVQDLDGDEAAMFLPYHLDGQGNAWYRDPITFVAAEEEVGGSIHRTLREGFLKGRQYRQEMIAHAPRFNLNPEEAAVYADCALAKMLAAHDIPLMLAAPEGLEHVVHDSMTNGPSIEDFRSTQRPFPNPEMN